MSPAKPMDCLTRRRMIEGLFAMALLQAAACTREDRPAPALRSRLRLLHWADESMVFAPFFGSSAQFLVFLPLVRANAATGVLEPFLARSWERSEDWRSWTVRLRDDVSWHDGVPVTAHDIEFTLELLQHPAVLVLPPGSIEIRVLDEHAFTAHFRGELRGSPADSWTVFYPRHILERLDPGQIRDWDFWVRPVGNGPYRYLRHVPRTMVELEASADFFRGRPRIEQVTVKFSGGEGPTPLTELLSANVDVISTPDRAPLLRLIEDPRYRVYDTFVPVFRTLLWNHRHAAFRDPRVRRALTHAANRRELHGVMNLPAETPVWDVPLTPRQLAAGDFAGPLPYDPAAARRLLDAAGWREPGGGGVRRKDGQPFSFTALVPVVPEAATYLQARYREIGVAMELRMMDYPVVRQLVRSGDFDAAFVHTQMRAGIDFPYIFGGDSPIGYRNPEAVRLLARSEGTASPDELDRIYRELWPAFQADLPALFLAPMVRTTVAHRSVRGLSSPHAVDPFGRMDELWLEEEPS